MRVPFPTASAATLCFIGCSAAVDEPPPARTQPSAPVGDLSLADATTTIMGAEDFEYLGYSLTSGDVDDDGHGDLVTRAFRTHPAMMVAGPVAEGPWVLESPAAALAATGISFAIDLRDLDGDGRDEFIGLGSGDGVAWVFDIDGSGRTWESDDATARIIGGSAEDYARRHSVGDVTGDGLADLVLALPGVDTIRVFAGPVEGDLAVGDGLLLALPEGTEDVALVADSDLDGDGVIDLLVGSNGTVWLLPGPISGQGERVDDAAAMTIEGPPGRFFGDSFLDTADLDGDGAADLLVGANLDPDGPARDALWVFMGPLSGDSTQDDADARIEAAHDEIGLRPVVSTGRDIDVDGNDDLLLALPGPNGAAVFYGPLSGTLVPGDADATLLDSGEQSIGANEVEIVPDMTNDGFPDLAIAQSQWDADEPDGARAAPAEGRIFIVPGGVR